MEQIETPHAVIQIVGSGVYKDTEQWWTMKHKCSLAYIWNSVDKRNGNKWLSRGINRIFS